MLEYRAFSPGRSLTRAKSPNGSLITDYDTIAVRRWGGGGAGAGERGGAGKRVDTTLPGVPARFLIVVLIWPNAG